MSTKSFREIFAEAKQLDSFWVEGAILEFTADIERLMLRRGITNAELANNLGTSRAYVTKALNGTANFTMSTMVKLSRAVGGNLHVHVADQEAVVQWFDKYDGRKTRKSQLINEEVKIVNITPQAGVNVWADMANNNFNPFRPVRVNENVIAR